MYSSLTAPLDTLVLPSSVSKIYLIMDESVVLYMTSTLLDFLRSTDEKAYRNRTNDIVFPGFGNAEEETTCTLE